MEDAEEQENILFQNIIYIILTIIITSTIILFVVRVAEGAAFNEQIYTKKLALLINSAKPGTTIIFDIDKGAKIAEKSNFKPDIEIKENKIALRLAPAKKEFENYDTFFRNLDVKAEYLENTHKIKLEILEKSE